MPCKFDPQRPIIFECVERIQKHHPKDSIVVVDSASEDKSYFKDLPSDVIIMDVNNKNYGTNAFYLAWLKYPNEPFYYFVYDSLFLNNNISHVEKDEFTCVRYFNTPDTGWGWNGNGESLHVWAEEQLKIHAGLDLPFPFRGIFGPMFFMSNDVMKRFIHSGFFNILSEDKFQLCGLERVAGIILQNMGIDVMNSLQGEMTAFWGDYDETYVTKVNMARG